MSVAVTLNLDESVLELLRHESKTRGLPLEQTLNEHLRTTLPSTVPQSVPFEVKPISSGLYPHLDYTNLSELVEELDGPWRR